MDKAEAFDAKPLDDPGRFALLDATLFRSGLATLEGGSPPPPSGFRFTGDSGRLGVFAFASLLLRGRFVRLVWAGLEGGGAPVSSVSSEPKSYAVLVLVAIAGCWRKRRVTHTTSVH